MSTNFSVVILPLILLFVIGLVFGSFGSVIVTRLGENINRKTLQSIMFGHSECPKCKTRLQRYQLIPVLSFIRQRGKCSTCKQKISRKYIILELGSALIFVFTYLFAQKFTSGTRAITIFWIATNWLLYLLIIFDIEKFELHVPIWLALLLLILLPQLIQGDNIKRVIIASLLFGGFFYLLYFAARYYVRKRYKTDHEGIGEGDAMLAFAIGAAIPLVFQIQNIGISRFAVVEIFVIFLILSSLIGLLLASIQVLCSKMIKSSQATLKIGKKKAIIMPFIPAMITAFWIILYFAQDLILLIFPTLG